MPNYSSNTTMIIRPTLSAGGCGTSSCGSSVDSCNTPGLARRKTRGAVIEKLQDFVQLSLGAPVVGIELDQQNLDSIVEHVLEWVEYYAPREYFNYYIFQTTPGVSVYTMPPEVGYIRHVAYRESPEFAFTSADLQGSIPIEYFYPGGAYSSIQGGLIDPVQPIWGRMGEWVLYKQYEQMFSRVSSNIGGWEWVSDMGYIKLYPTPCRGQRVIVHYLQKCKDWKEVTQAMQEGALC